jgi:hypothetical protein
VVTETVDCTDYTLTTDLFTWPAVTEVDQPLELIITLFMGLLIKWSSGQSIVSPELQCKILSILKVDLGSQKAIDEDG